MPGVFKVGSVEANKATVQQLTLDDIENLKSVVVELQQNINKFNAIIGNYSGNLEVLEDNIDSLEGIIGNFEGNLDALEGNVDAIEANLNMAEFA